MSESALTRRAGPVALAAGALFAAVDLVLFVLMTPDDRIAMLTDPVFRVVNAAYFFAFVGLAIALLAVHGRQARESGGFGTVALLAALVGTMTQGGNMWFDGFAAPWLAEVVPQVYTAERTPILIAGALLSYTLMAVGWVLYGIASWRARVFPVSISAAVVVGGVLAFQSGWPPYGVPIGLAVAAMGGWLVHRDRAVRQVPERAAV